MTDTSAFVSKTAGHSPAGSASTIPEMAGSAVSSPASSTQSVSAGGWNSQPTN